MLHAVYIRGFKKGYIVLLLLFSCFWAFGQEHLYSYKTQTVDLQNTRYCSDSLKWVPKSLIIMHGDRILLPQKDYILEDTARCIVFSDMWTGKTIEISGRVFNPRIINYTTYNKNSQLIEPEYAKNPFDYYVERPSGGSDRRDEGGFNIQGNISRGVGVGSTQDLILSSNLNLQIQGNIGDDITVIAAISDENTPIQPEGNTQQIQDFDQVYISFMRDSSRLTVGDFEMLPTPGDYFKQYYKKSRGVQLIHKQELKGGVNESVAEFAVSRGRFSRNEIQGEEGNQGPYRLVGSNGEVFIMIIAGTEIVYVDGKQLSRGQQNDYIIDYNTGELTFMPKVLINRFSRIVIEFQYADRNYARSVVQGSNVYTKGNVNIRAGYFSEQDNRNQPFQQSLDLFDSSTNRSAIDIMSEAGNDPSLAVIPNVTRFTTFQKDRIMYRQIDTLGLPIYQYTTNPLSDSVFYQVSFTRVGQGNGNYRQQVGLANGRVFEWVAPVGGVPAGDYEPVVQLVTPERLQMFTAGLDWDIDSNTRISVELVSSNRDANRFSSIDNENNVGYGAHVNIDRKDYVTVGKKTWQWKNHFSWEWVDDNFEYIERYRDVEFERNWSRQYVNPSAKRVAAEERILGFNGSIEIPQTFQLQYNIGAYNRGEAFDGYRYGLGMQFQHKGLSIEQDALWIRSELAGLNPVSQDAVVNSNDAYDIRGSITQQLGSKSTLRFDYASEQSIFAVDSTESLLLSSFNYSQTGLTFTRNLGNDFSSSVHYNRRTDQLPVGAEMERSVVSDNLSVNLEKQGRNWKDRLILTMSYRAMTDYMPDIEEDLPERTLMSRVEYQIPLFKRALVSNTFYQVGTGREQRREFTFVEVPPGRGTHTWIDYNENGIQEINEFEPAVFSDQANFIKVMLPTNEFIRSNTNEFNQTLRLTPPVRWQSEKGIKKLLSRFSAVHSFRSDRRSTDNRLEKVLNPIDFDIADSALINLSSLAKTTLFFNRSNPKFGAEYNRQNNNLKQFLIQGFDSRVVHKDAISLRFNMNSEWSILTKAEHGNRSFLSDFSPNRNYRFDFTEYKPELQWQPGKFFRLSGFYKYYEARNLRELGGEQAFWSELGTEFRTFIQGKTTLDGKMSLIDINFRGDAISPVAFDMLKGLQNGRNLNWSVLIGGKIGSNIQVSLNYEGRSSETAPIVHIGRAEARYLF